MAHLQRKPERYESAREGSGGGGKGGFRMIDRVTRAESGVCAFAATVLDGIAAPVEVCLGRHLYFYPWLAIYLGGTELRVTHYLNRHYPSKGKAIKPHSVHDKKR